ncbi:hypothetical protein [Okeania sp. SIO1F9]|uniref:hypothetical protein n=1 Tax=Okeania sp. SIO1F9 TaxID=2607813 RepID=UPI00144D6FB4|nr:hypothetical protein [Okeania sp. SIO1F9]NET75387.1 hypothetical protein [Okeania sp. SIO1F9]
MVKNCSGTQRGCFIHKFLNLDLTFQWLKTVPEHKRDVLPKFFGPDCSANRCLIRACQITLKVFTDIGFSIFGLKKVPAFQWQELQKASILGWLWQKN